MDGMQSRRESSPYVQMVESLNRHYEMFSDESLPASVRFSCAKDYSAFCLTLLRRHTREEYGPLAQEDKAMLWRFWAACPGYLKVITAFLERFAGEPKHERSAKKVLAKVSDTHQKITAALEARREQPRPFLVR